METFKFIDGLKDRSPNNIRSILYQKGILSSYHPEDGRMVFYSSKNQRFSELSNSENLTLWSECNGLVFDTKNNNVLATPSESFRSAIDLTTINNNLSKNLYDLFLVEDGTVVNLYYWEPLKSWRMSTARSYDITDTKWGALTYREIIGELLAINNTTEDQFYDSLDKNTSYTFGFKHACMHPFRAGLSSSINKLWFIQSVSDNIVSYDFANTHQIPSQIKYEFPKDVPQTAQYLLNKLNCGLDNFLKSGDVLYGYILRTKNKSETGSHGNILLESSLLQKIRQLYYHSNLNNISKTMNYNRDLYTIVFSYLSINTHTMFIKLFPQYNPVYNKLDAITSKLVNQVITYANKGPNPTRIEPETGVVKFIFESINNQYRITPNDRRNVKLISSFLLSVNYIDIYYTLASA